MWSNFVAGGIIWAASSDCADLTEHVERDGSWCRDQEFACQSRLVGFQVIRGKTVSGYVRGFVTLSWSPGVTYLAANYCRSHGGTNMAEQRAAIEDSAKVVVFA